MPARTSRRTELPVEILVDRYLTALDAVTRAGFGHEIDWQEQRSLDQLTEPDFLREAAWVILCSGMREQIIRERFSTISTAFLDWSSGEAIVRRCRACTRAALAVFAYGPKIEAIVAVARHVWINTFPTVHLSLKRSGVAALEPLPFIGPVTKFHLAKNLGMDVAKPDRHLVRMSCAAGYPDPGRLCALVSSVTGDRVGTVDLVLWRYATICRGYQNLFSTKSE